MTGRVFPGPLFVFKLPDPCFPPCASLFVPCSERLSETEKPEKADKIEVLNVWGKADALFPPVIFAVTRNPNSSSPPIYRSAKSA
jgi:hypothetical protein